MASTDELERTTGIYYRWHDMRHAHLAAARAWREAKAAKPVATSSAASARPSPSASDSGEAKPKRRRRELWIELQAKPSGRSADAVKDANEAQLLTVLISDHSISECERTAFIVIGYGAGDDQEDVVLACKSNGVVHLRLLPWEYLPRGAHKALQKIYSRATSGTKLKGQYWAWDFLPAHYQRGPSPADNLDVLYIAGGPLIGRTCNEVTSRALATGQPAAWSLTPLCRCYTAGDVQSSHGEAELEDRFNQERQQEWESKQSEQLQA